MRMVRKTLSLEDTEKLGQDLSEILRPGDVVTLTGDLGAGKTTLVNAICKGLGAEETSSPTFTIVNTYTIPLPAYGDDSVSDFVRAHVEKATHETNFHHIDFYRIETVDELIERGIPEFISDTDSIVVVEWAERFQDIFDDLSPISIEIEIDGENERTFIIKNLKDR